MLKLFEYYYYFRNKLFLDLTKTKTIHEIKKNIFLH